MRSRGSPSPVGVKFSERGPVEALDSLGGWVPDYLYELGRIDTAKPFCRLGKALPRERTRARGRQRCLLLATPQARAAEAGAAANRLRWLDGLIIGRFFSTSYPRLLCRLARWAAQVRYQDVCTHRAHPCRKNQRDPQARGNAQQQSQCQHVGKKRQRPRHKPRPDPNSS
jgi:hypothetical protein